MASGMVCVRPGKLPANVIVAPNSPSARAQHSAAPAATDGRTSGRVMRRNTFQRFAPSVRAALSSRRSSVLRTPSIESTKNGMATNVSASTAPAVVKGRRMPRGSRNWPSRPRRPKTESSATPPTTGGSTTGSSGRARSNERPGNTGRARVQARGSPSTTGKAPAARRTDQRQPHRHERLGLQERTGEIAPGGFPQETDERQDEQGGPERRDERGGDGHALVGAVHGGRKPASARTRWPRCDSTYATNSFAPAAFGAPLSTAIG